MKLNKNKFILSILVIILLGIIFIVKQYSLFNVILSILLCIPFCCKKPKLREFVILAIIIVFSAISVSYTHLDVYKRQVCCHHGC